MQIEDLNQTLFYSDIVKKRQNKEYRKADFVVEDIYAKDLGLIESLADIANTQLIHVNNNRTVSL